MKFNMLHLENQPLEKEIPALEIITFRFHVELGMCNKAHDQSCLVCLGVRFPYIKNTGKIHEGTGAEKARTYPACNR